MKYCRYKGTLCEFATENGYCTFTVCIRERGDGMIYHVEGWFEGDIDADSREEAEGNFDAMDIEDMDIRVVYEVTE